MSSPKEASRHSLRVAFRWERSDRHAFVTWAAACVALVAVTMAIVGLPPVDLHGPLHKLGVMDPFCGGTRAARYTAQGNLIQAWEYNPLGILVVVASFLGVVRAMLGLLARRWINLDVQMSRTAKRVLIALTVVAFMLLQVRQQMRADLLMQGTGIWL